MKRTRTISALTELGKRCAIGLTVTVAAIPSAIAAPPTDLDARVEAAMDAFDQPGLALAIVEPDDTTVRGYGVTQAGGDTPVTEQTIFNIASVTKAFTAAALAILVDEGMVEWEAPVRRYLPEFAMSDPYLTEHMTVRDLLVHRSGLGLGAGDLMIWPGTDFTRAEIVDRIRYLPLESGFRSGYAYDNMLYIVAGELIGRVSGLDYEDFIRSRIFEPLGMEESYTSRVAAPAEDNRAIAHARIGGPVRGLGPLIPLEMPMPVTNTAPAGGIVTSAQDFAPWLRTVARQGVIEGERRLYSAEQARELWYGRTIIYTDPLPTEDPEDTHFALYALGWEIDDYRGHPIVWHAGSLAGMTAIAVVIPGRDTAFAIFINSEEAMTMRTMRNSLLDRYLGLEPFDWLADGQRIAAQMTAQMEAMAADLAAGGSDETGEHAPPPQPLAAYAGTYRDPWYGDIVISVADERLRIHFTRSSALKGALEPWNGDTFRTGFDDRSVENAFVNFTYDEAGGITGATLRAVSEFADFSYDYQHLRPVRVAE